MTQQFPRSPRHGFIIRDKMQNNGLFVKNEAFYVHSGTIESVQGSTTGSVALNFDAYGLKLKRFECFHSGAASVFDVSIESSSPNTGSFYDPRKVVTEYTELVGSDDFSTGIDQVEDLLTLTDINGNLHLKVKPYGSGNNTFKYLMFCEAVYIYLE